MPRLRAIDLFRGATIAAMVLVNAPFSYEGSYRQAAHAAWNGGMPAVAEHAVREWPPGPVVPSLSTRQASRGPVGRRLRLNDYRPMPS